MALNPRGNGARALKAQRNTLAAVSLSIMQDDQHNPFLSIA